MRSFFSRVRNHHALTALQFRTFRLVCGGQIFGNIGTWMDELSRGWLMYQLTDSVVQLGLARGIQLVPTLLVSPFAGTAADRYSRKTLLLVSQSVQGLSFAALALLILSGHVAPWHVYVTAVIAGTMQAIQQPARASIVTESVPPESLTNAIGVTSLIFNMARLLGPAMAGAIIAVAGTGGAFALQAACMFMATLWVSKLPAMPHPEDEANKGRRESFARSIVEGWKFSWQNQSVRAGILCTTIVCGLMFPFATLLPVFARDLLGVGAQGQGILLAAMGFGALLSAATIAVAGHRLTRGRVMMDSSIVYGFALVVFAVSPWYSLSIVAMVVAGLCHVHANALVHTVVQSYSPPAYRGRAMALFNMSQMLSTAGSVLIGLLAVVLGSRGAVAVMGIVGALGIVALAWRMPGARRIQ
ncbi:MAG: MFS transporter [Betaproteobacteria bacterium]|nr:MFS transporter [Betaproteobacteria bacterium]